MPFKYSDGYGHEGLPAYLPKNCVIALPYESEIEEYRGNSLIEALGPLPSREELASVMTYRPPYHESERNLSQQERLDRIALIDEVYVPLTPHHAVALDICSMIRPGYKHRNPMQPIFNAQLQKTYEERLKNRAFKSAPLLNGMCKSGSLIGISGLGKSKLLERSLAQFPPVIWHPDLRRFQIPYLIVQCPKDGGTIALARNFLRALDTTLGSKYEEINGSGATEDHLTALFHNLARVYGVGLLVIDEIQNARIAKTTRGSEAFLNFIVGIVNASVCPVEMVGTLSSVEILTQTQRSARRSLGPTLENLPEGDEWLCFLDGIWGYQWTKTPIPLTKALAKSMYYHCQGNLAVASTLYMFAQRRAIVTGSEKITTELIKTVSQQELTRIAPMIDAQRRNDRKAMITFGDLTVPKYDPKESITFTERVSKILELKK